MSHLFPQVIHPLRTLGASMSAVAEDRKVSSQGYLSWDEAANQKVFYELQVSDDSQNFRRVSLWCAQYRT